jgi:hypothetical protein
VFKEQNHGYVYLIENILQKIVKIINVFQADLNKFKLKKKEILSQDFCKILLY